MGDSEGNWNDDSTADQPRGSEAAVQCRQISLREFLSLGSDRPSD